MEVKTFEVRDRATFIPCIGIRIGAFETEGADQYLVRRAGYGDPIVLFGRLDGGDFHYDPYEWGGGARTMQQAHRYVEQCWKNLHSGEVIDVEYILGEKPTRKMSERCNDEA